MIELYRGNKKDFNLLKTKQRYGLVFMLKTDKIKRVEDINIIIEEILEDKTRKVVYDGKTNGGTFEDKGTNPEAGEIRIMLISDRIALSNREYVAYITGLEYDF